MEEGASIPVGLFTSYHALYAQPPYGGGLVSAMSPGGRGKYAGQPIVILGGAGATGHFGMCFLGAIIACLMNISSSSSTG